MSDSDRPTPDRRSGISEGPLYRTLTADLNLMGIRKLGLLMAVGKLLLICRPDNVIINRIIFTISMRFLT